MKEKLIAAIREVPISKTYEDYVEALADKLEFLIEDTRREVAREIFEEIETLLYLNALQGDVFTGRYFSEELQTDIAELKKKYTEGKG